MVDVVKTRAQIIERAGTDLGLVQPGESLSPEDYNTLDNLFDPLIAQLSAERIISISDADAIDVKIFLPVASLLANYAGPSFGSPINDQAMIRDQGTLKRIEATDPVYAPQHGEYF